jgi:hypothetical protein
MNADEIRTEAFRRALEAIQDHGCSHADPWDEALNACPGCYLVAVAAIEALGDMLPTYVRWIPVLADYSDLEFIDDNDSYATRDEAASALQRWYVPGALAVSYRTAYAPFKEADAA